MNTIMNPDCRDGKHRSCAGDGWNEADDASVPCSCPCHGASQTTTVQRVSPMFAAENRTITSADMSGSRYVRASVAPPSTPRPPTMDELQEGLALAGIVVEPWQLDFATRVIRYGGRRQSSNRYSFTRPKTDDRTHPFYWAASKQPSPYMYETPPSLQLDMWTSDQPLAPDPRQQALAAKAAQGKGPPSSESWRGKERNTKYRSQ